MLAQRAALYRHIREFFYAVGVMEVDVPVLGASTVTDPHLEALPTRYDNRTYYLQTSPEYFLKRLLVNGSGAIYSMGKAFRYDQASKRHNPEFTMLEWYQPGFDEQDLIDQVLGLIVKLSPQSETRKCSYKSLFEQYLGVNPHTASADDLASIAKERLSVDWPDEPLSTWFDLLFSHFVEPNLTDVVYAVYDYPECQCALARIAENDVGETVARRFEIYWHGLELANGYWELCDPEAHRERFDRDNQLRQDMGLPVMPLDEAFLTALESGLPECAGVALGVDRLLMCVSETFDIADVMPFPLKRL